jgi:hypothetical protein
MQVRPGAQAPGLLRVVPKMVANRGSSSRRYSSTPSGPSALAARDPDELIAVKANDLRVPDDYAEIAGLFAETGRIDEAIRWCELGLTDYADRTRQLEPLRELLASLRRSLVDAERTGSQAQVQHLSATIIEVLLFEGSVEDAWRAATERDCDQRLWMRRARARGTGHPADAIPIYEREVEALIDKKNDAGYRAAVKLMVHVESLQFRLERPRLPAITYT